VKSALWGFEFKVKIFWGVENFSCVPFFLLLNWRKTGKSGISVIDQNNSFQLGGEGKLDLGSSGKTMCLILSEN